MAKPVAPSRLRSKPKTLTEFVAEIERTSSDRVIVVGPMRWQPRDDGGKRWYFVTSYKRRGKFYSMVTDTPDYEPPVTLDDVPEMVRRAADGSFLINPVSAREKFRTQLTTLRSFIVHDMDDEVAMARLCESLWPTERTKRLRAAVEAELLPT
jgi:hypothetical protein